MRPAVRPRHRLHHERLRGLDRSQMGRTPGGRGLGRRGLPLQIAKDGISTYAVDWQLRELGGVVRKAPPKDGSYRVLDLPPFLASLMQQAMDNRRGTCRCLALDGHPACKGDHPT